MTWTQKEKLKPAHIDMLGNLDISLGDGLEEGGLETCQLGDTTAILAAHFSGTVFSQQTVPEALVSIATGSDFASTHRCP